MTFNEFQWKEYHQHHSRWGFGTTKRIDSGEMTYDHSFELYSPPLKFANNNNKQKVFNDMALKINPYVYVNKFNPYTILELFSYIGGLANFFKGIFSLVAALFSFANVKYQLIRKLYFNKTPDFLARKFIFIPSLPYRYVYKEFKNLQISMNPCKREKNQTMAERQLERDLDIIQLIDTIYKMKASLDVLIANDRSMLR